MSTLSALVLSIPVRTGPPVAGPTPAGSDGGTFDNLLASTTAADGNPPGEHNDSTAAGGGTAAFAPAATFPGAPSRRPDPPIDRASTDGSPTTSTTDGAAQATPDAGSTDADGPLGSRDRHDAASSGRGSGEPGVSSTDPVAGGSDPTAEVAAGAGGTATDLGRLAAPGRGPEKGTANAGHRATDDRGVHTTLAANADGIAQTTTGDSSGTAPTPGPAIALSTAHDAADPARQGGPTGRGEAVGPLAAGHRAGSLDAAAASTTAGAASSAAGDDVAGGSPSTRGHDAHLDDASVRAPGGAAGDRGPTRTSLSGVVGTTAHAPAPADTAHGSTAPPLGAVNGATRTTPGSATPTARSADAATPAPRDLPGVASQLVGTIVPLRLAPNGAQTVTISLHPAELGEVRVAMTVLNDQTTVRLIASTPEGAAAIRASIDDLQSQLSDAGQHATVILDNAASGGQQQNQDQGSGNARHDGAAAGTGAVSPTATDASGDAAPTAPAASDHLIDVRI